MRKNLAALYFMFLIFIGLGVFSLWQFVVPLFQESTEPEDPYMFTELQELADISETESTIEYDAEALFAQNNDFVGWLAIPDTTISFPIVQGDDNSFYLNHGFNKAYSAYGCPFLDTRTPIGGDNLVIHGHNMGNNRKEVFSPLLLFQNGDYANQHKSAYFSIYPSNIQYQYELFAVVNFNSNNELSYFFSEFEDQNHRDELIQFFKRYSFYDTEFSPNGDILILSTCNRRYGKDNRLLLCFGEITP